MKDLFKSGKSYPLNIALVALVAALALWYAGGSVLGWIQQSHSDSAVSHSETMAAHESTDAAHALDTANASSVDRRVEDRVREQTIAPELHRAAERAELTKERARVAAKTYEDIQKHFVRPALDERGLCDRNGADFRELYPGQSYPDCR